QAWMMAAGAPLWRAIFGLTRQADGFFRSSILSRAELSQVWLGDSEGRSMYGGLLLAQAMSAAAASAVSDAECLADSGLRFDSLSAYFLRAGAHTESVRYLVESLSRSSGYNGCHVLRVTAFQAGPTSPILLCQIAFTRSQPISAFGAIDPQDESSSSQPISAVGAIDPQDESSSSQPISACPLPEVLPKQESFLAAQLHSTNLLSQKQRNYIEKRLCEARTSAIELRPCNPFEFFRLSPAAQPSVEFWIRLKAEFFANKHAALTPLQKQILMLFLSDKGLLRGGEVTRPDERFHRKASLDHRIAFHELDVDPFEWSLYRASCIRAARSHRLNVGRLWSLTGRQIITASQQSFTATTAAAAARNSSTESSKL
ncbi:hypothetical protein BOX15_Mlig032056g2, partial [Macrostomum lignano]